MDEGGGDLLSSLFFLLFHKDLMVFKNLWLVRLEKMLDFILVVHQTTQIILVIIILDK